MAMSLSALREGSANFISSLRMDAAGSSETLVPTYQTLPQTAYLLLRGWHEVFVTVKGLFTFLYELQRFLMLIQILPAAL
jgi:hypothetical protein